VIARGALITAHTLSNRTATSPQRAVRLIPFANSQALTQLTDMDHIKEQTP
jgi:hypothetical protein